jgi:hypothetical protein
VGPHVKNVIECGTIIAKFCNHDVLWNSDEGEKEKGEKVRGASGKFRGPKKKCSKKLKLRAEFPKRSGLKLSSRFQLFGAFWVWPPKLSARPSRLFPKIDFETGIGMGLFSGFTKSSVFSM